VRGAARVTGAALGVTPNTPIQAQGGAGIDNGREARWRFARHNGEWWYYTPQNNWMYHRNGQWNAFTANNFQPLNQNAMGQAQIAQGQAPIQAQAQLPQGGSINQQGAQRFSYAPGQQPAPQAQPMQQNYAPAAGYNGGNNGGSDSFIPSGRWDFGGSLPARAPRNVNQDGVPATWGNVTR
jgi:hypothetical protein